MGRNKFSSHEIERIAKLLRLKNAGTRYQQKVVRHELRVKYEFNISDFNVQGKAFGEEDLQAAIRRGAIQILDDATIAAMKEKRARDKARDEAARREQQAAEERSRECVCGYCGKTFTTARWNARYCSEECGYKAQIKRQGERKAAERKQKNLPPSERMVTDYVE